MEALLFFAFILVAVVFLALHLRKTSTNPTTELSREQKASQLNRQRRANKMVTPGNNRMSSNNKIWQARRKHVGLVSESADKTTGQRYFSYKDNAEPEYDGYSRADRHHITPAHIKEEKHLDDLELPGSHV